MYGASEHTRKLMERFRHLQFAAVVSDVSDSGVAAGGADPAGASGDSATSAADSRYEASVANDRCGDSVRLLVWLDATGERILQLRHHSVGCSICRVSAD